MLLIKDVIERNAEFYPEKEAIVFGENRVTWKEVNDRSNRLANWLIEKGIKKGDRVAILAHNCSQYYEIYFAGVKISSIVATINYRYVSNEVGYVIEDARPTVVFVGEDYIDILDEAKKNHDFSGVREYVCIEKSVNGMNYYEDILQSSSSEIPNFKIEETDPAFLLYTGGTTGRPKGVIWTNKCILESCRNWLLETKTGRNNVQLISAPVFHSGALWLSLCGMYVGDTLVVLEGPNPPERMLLTIQEEKVTYGFMPPAIIQYLLDLGEKVKTYDLSSLRYIIDAAAPMSGKKFKQAMELLGCPFVNLGGLTEACCEATVIWLDKFLDGSPLSNERLGSAGRQVVNVHIKVVDTNDNEVPRGQTGELVIKGGNVTPGYWNKPNETAEAIKNGWLHSGDLVKMDEDGYIYYVDRLKDMIITGGENVYSREVEEVIEKHPAIKEVCVIGVPDKKWGEALKACIVLKEGASLTEEELIKFCKKWLANFKVPKTVDIIDLLPRSALGKVLKRDIRDKYWIGYEKRVN